MHDESRRGFFEGNLRDSSGWLTTKLQDEPTYEYSSYQKH